MYRAGFHVIITVAEKSSAIIVRLFVDIPSVIFAFADTARCDGQGLPESRNFSPAILVIIVIRYKPRQGTDVLTKC